MAEGQEIDCPWYWAWADEQGQATYLIDGGWGRLMIFIITIYINHIY